MKNNEQNLKKNIFKQTRSNTPKMSSASESAPSNNQEIITNVLKADTTQTNVQN